MQYSKLMNLEHEAIQPSGIWHVRLKIKPKFEKLIENPTL